MDEPPIQYARTEDWVNIAYSTLGEGSPLVCDRAEPGQVLVSNVVKELCRGKTFLFEDQGEATLKGFPEPVRLFTVGVAE
jgi:hypothetical protein